MKRFSKGFIFIIILSLLMGAVSLPDSVRSQLPDVPVIRWFKGQTVTLGLDLQGGTQLDYRIDLRSAEERNNDEDPENDVVVTDIIEGVRHTIERRVDGLGVSEPNIYISEVAGEKHIIVELAGIKDVDEAKAVVGKTIQLEFKEPKEEPDPNFVETIRSEAQATLQKAQANPGDFKNLGETLQTPDQKVEFRPEQAGFFSNLGENMQAALSGLEPGQVYGQLVDNQNDFVVSSDGQLVEREGFLIVRLDAKESRENTKVESEEKVKASHILIAYQGAERASEGIIRSKEEAKKEAEKVLSEVKANPDNFETLAREYSDDPSVEANGGDLDFFGRGAMAPEFENAAFLMEPGQISEVVESSFGYHIIMVTDKQAAVEKTVEEDYVTYSVIFYNAADDPWQATDLNGSHFKAASVVYSQVGTPEVSIQFDSEGAQMFEELTDRLTGKRLAIFVGGELVSAPQVNGRIPGTGGAVITGSFTLQDALRLSNDLNTGAIDAPITLSGQYTISASLGENALNLSLYAGLIGLIALSIFMLLYYRLPGFFAVIALAIYSIIMIFVIKTTGIVMSLAGIAGIILSIGMAVDANILIFERTREEWAKGNSYAAAIATGFDRAWSSIWDSNVSSLITCLILWFFGNSIVRGFALMLGLGVLISMFTAINVTRTFLQTLNNTKVAENKFLMGVKK